MTEEGLLHSLPLRYEKLRTLNSCTRKLGSKEITLFYESTTASPHLIVWSKDVLHDCDEANEGWLTVGEAEGTVQRRILVQ